VIHESLVKSPPETKGVPVISQNEPVWVRINKERFKLDLGGRVVLTKEDFRVLIQESKD